MESIMTYKIQQKFFDGWGEAFPYDPADQIPPDRYDTKEKAQSALTEMLNDMEVKDYEENEFRIVEVKK
jgi:hypothetical protein